MPEAARCYYVALTSLPPLMAELRPHMPHARRATMDAFVRIEDKWRSAAAWLLMRTVLGPAASLIRRGQFGKPFLPGGPYFSIAHSGRYVIMAVSSCPVGADIEEIRPEYISAALRTLVLHPRERATYGVGSDASRFFDLWTQKESYFKLRGRGLMEDPASLWLRPLPQAVSHCPKAHFALYHQLPGHSVSLCVYGGAPPETLLPLPMRGVASMAADSPAQLTQGGFIPPSSDNFTRLSQQELS